VTQENDNPTSSEDTTEEAVKYAEKETASKIAETLAIYRDAQNKSELAVPENHE
jgi:hypothetical protein